MVASSRRHLDEQAVSRVRLFERHKHLRAQRLFQRVTQAPGDVRVEELKFFDDAFPARVVAPRERITHHTHLSSDREMTRSYLTILRRRQGRNADDDCEAERVYADTISALPRLVALKCAARKRRVPAENSIRPCGLRHEHVSSWRRAPK